MHAYTSPTVSSHELPHLPFLPGLVVVLYLFDAYDRLESHVYGKSACNPMTELQSTCASRVATVQPSSHGHSPAQVLALSTCSADPRGHTMGSQRPQAKHRHMAAANKTPAASLNFSFFEQTYRQLYLLRSSIHIWRVFAAKAMPAPAQQQRQLAETLSIAQHLRKPTPTSAASTIFSNRRKPTACSTPCADLNLPRVARRLGELRSDRAEPELRTFLNPLCRKQTPPIARPAVATRIPFPHCSLRLGRLSNYLRVVVCSEQRCYNARQRFASLPKSPKTRAVTSLHPRTSVRSLRIGGRHTRPVYLRC